MELSSDSKYEGFPFVQLYHVFPNLEEYYFHFEKFYAPFLVQDVMIAAGYLPVALVIVYMLFCYFGQIWMVDKKPFDLRIPLALWNLFLSLFSTYGVIRMVPHTLHLIATRPFVETICSNARLTYGLGSAGLAVQLFVLSKIPELIDTVFIVLRKKKLIFLHWYHHVTVLLFCWHAYITEAGSGHYYASMNYTVHAIMYFYYFLMAIRCIPSWFPSWIITLLQIAQMFGGMFVVGMSIYYFYFGAEGFAPGECSNTTSVLLSGVLMYGTYLYLFVEFAVLRFLVPSKKTNRTE